MRIIAGRIKAPRSQRLLNCCTAKAAASTAGTTAMRLNRIVLSPCTHGPVITKTPTAQAHATQSSVDDNDLRRNQDAAKAARAAAPKKADASQFCPNAPGIPGRPPGPMPGGL